MDRRITAFINDDNGNDILEYAFLAGLLSLACFAALTAIGVNIKNMFGALSAKFDTVLP